MSQRLIVEMEVGAERLILLTYARITRGEEFGRTPELLRGEAKIPTTTGDVDLPSLS
jgi:hypothetical protein